jgi:repressor LexA
MRPEPTSAEVRARLAQLAASRHRVTLAGLSRMLSRNERYLDRFVREGQPPRLNDDDRRSLATFFGVPEWELGGHILPGEPDTRWRRT